MTITTVRTVASPLTEVGEARLNRSTTAWKVAASTDDTAAYDAAHAALLADLTAAYGIDGPEVYEVMMDSWESARYCAAAVADRRANTTRYDARTEYETVVWNAIVDGLRGSLPAPLDMDDAYAVANDLTRESNDAWTAYARTDLCITWDDFNSPLRLSTLDALPAPVNLDLDA